MRCSWGVSMAENKYVVFRLGNEKYGLPIECVERILPTQDVTRLPRTPKMMLGVFEMRGTTVPAIDARLRFDLEESDECQNFVVVLGKAGRCALSVDNVDGIITLSEEEIEENSSLFDSKADDFVRGIGKQNDSLLVLLDPDGLIPPNLRKKIAAAA
jgi:purine-binding chemotaxis protein CheW